MASYISDCGGILQSGYNNIIASSLKKKLSNYLKIMEIHHLTIDFFFFSLMKTAKLDEFMF